LLLFRYLRETCLPRGPDTIALRRSVGMLLEQQLGRIVAAERCSSKIYAPNGREATRQPGAVRKAPF
jgi:hypothetical protein